MESLHLDVRISIPHVEASLNVSATPPFGHIISPVADEVIKVRHNISHIKERMSEDLKRIKELVGFHFHDSPFTNLKDKIQPHRLQTNDLPQPALVLSQKLIEEITDLPPDGDPKLLVINLQSLQDAIPSIADKNSLTTLEKNIDTFDQVRAQKAQTSSDWNEVENLIESIKWTIYTQEMSLPNPDDLPSILKKIQAVMEQIQNKLDQFSTEQITYLFSRVANLQKVVDSLTTDFKNSLEQEISQMNEKINGKIDKLIEEMKDDKVLDYKAALLDYLVGENVGIHTVLAKQYEIKDLQQQTDITLLMIMQNFRMEKFVEWHSFSIAVGKGLPELPEVPPIPVLAHKMEQCYVDFIFKNRLLTLYLGFGGLNPIDNARPDELSVGSTIKWKTGSENFEQGKLLSWQNVDHFEDFPTIESGWAGLIEKQDGQKTKMVWPFIEFIPDDFEPNLLGYQYDSIYVDGQKISVLDGGILVQKPGGEDVISFDQVLLRTISGPSGDYQTDPLRLLPDLSTTLESVKRLHEIKKLMGDRLFSTKEIMESFSISAIIPPLPPSLNTEFLSQPCPYEANKRICDSHFLFHIPASMPGKQYTWRHFVKNFVFKYRYGESKCRRFDIGNTHFELTNTFTEGSEFIVVDPFDLFYDKGGRWVLVYPQPLSKGSNGYRQASFEETVTAAGFWYAKTQQPLLSDMPSPTLYVRNLGIV